MARAFSAQMSGQMPGWPAATRVMSRKPPAARRSSAPSCSAPRAGRVHEGGRHEVGHVRHHGHEPVVIRRREHEHVGPQAHHDALQPVERLQVGGRGRRQDPDRSLEEVGVGPVQPDLLGPGHGVPADEARVVRLLDDRAS